MTSERIMEVAMDYFSEHGYAGTSFALIADAVGIRKQSIYAHFASKEELYFRCFARAMTIEKQRASQYLAQMPVQLGVEQLKQMMYEYILSNRSQKSVIFLYRAGLFAPQKYKLHNQKYIFEYREIILDVFRPLVLSLLETYEYNEKRVKVIIETLFCIYDGCMVELILNGNQAFQQRFESAWPLFWGSIVQKIG